MDAWTDSILALALPDAEFTVRAYDPRTGDEVHTFMVDTSSRPAPRAFARDGTELQVRYYYDGPILHSGPDVPGAPKPLMRRVITPGGAA